LRTPRTKISLALLSSLTSNQIRFFFASSEKFDINSQKLQHKKKNKDSIKRSARHFRVNPNIGLGTNWRRLYSIIPHINYATRLLQ